MITHVVLLSLTDPAERAETLQRLRAFRDQIPTLQGLRCGHDITGRDIASDIVLITEHADIDGLQAYQEHPVHQEFLAWLRPRLRDRAVVDTDELA